MTATNLTFANDFMDDALLPASLSAGDWRPSVTSTTLDNRDTLSASATSHWIPSVVSTMNQLINLPPNWDSYGAKPVDPLCAFYAMELLDVVMKPSTPVPIVVPTSSGCVQLEWHTGGIDLEIRVAAQNRLDVYFDNQSLPDAEWEGQVTFDLRPLLHFVNALSQIG